MKSAPLTPTARWLRKAREELGLSRHALALAADVAPGTLRNAEEDSHRLSRDCAARLMAEIARRDALLALTAPAPLLQAARLRAESAGASSKPGVPSKPGAPVPLAPPPLASLRFHCRGARALLQLELDPRTVRKFVATIADLLTRSERFPLAHLPALNLVLIETK